MKKVNLVRPAEVDPIEISEKKERFFSKGVALILGANLLVVLMIYLVIFKG